MAILDPKRTATLLLSRDHPAEVKRLDRAGALHRVRPGVFAAADEWAGLRPWEQYEQRIEGVAQTWLDPVFCLESAAPSHRLPLFGETRDIHLLSPDGTSRRVGDVVLHGYTERPKTVVRDGRHVTDMDETTLALCRALPPAFALAVADAALRMGEAIGKRLDLGERGRERPDRRGLRQLDWVQCHANARAESPGESVSRAVIFWLGYEDPDIQEEFFYEGFTDRSDFYWRRLRRIGESDGYGKYNAADAEETKQRFIDEKLREDRLRRYEDGFIRWDWSDSVKVTPLDRKLRVGGIPLVRPRNAAMLATLARNPRSFTPAERRQRQQDAAARARRGRA